MPFHNPYHFVPVERVQETDRIAFDDPALTHERYLPGRSSGRVVCRLVTETPTFVGARRTPAATDPAQVEHYTLDGLPAIPATTLRGMISSLVEAATNSSLRVLEDETYSYRRKMGEALSAIGMIVEEGGNLRLRPLTLPLLKRRDDGRGRRVIDLPEKYQQLYRQQDRPHLRAYFGDEDHAGVRDYHDRFRTYTDEHRRFYYLRLPGCSWERNGRGVAVAQQNLLGHPGAFFGQQKENANDLPITQEEYDGLSDAEQARHTRGILRIMKVRGRDLPNNRHLEVFIPYPPGAEGWKTFEIQAEALSRFESLCKERDARENEGVEDEKQMLPYHPVSTPRNKPGNAARRFRLKSGDLVFFEPSVYGTTIAEISLSSIWRSRVEDRQSHAHTARAFFREVDRDLLPFSDERTCVTTAESMFGFVNESKRAKAGGGLMRAFAGRVFPSAARLFGVRRAHDSAGWAEGSRERSLAGAQPTDTTLKILSGPKPPSPAMYFTGKDAEGAPRGEYIPKEKLNANEHRAQGRKFYLHHRDADGSAWATREPREHAKQKVSIRPVESGTVFYFHVDYENLSARELGALLYALRPTREFRHKLGMGKSLGLGRVRVEPVAVLGVDRAARYSARGLFAPRYSGRWLAGADDYGWNSAADDELPELYARDIASQEAQLPVPGPAGMYTDFRDGMLPKIRHALELIGDPAKLRARVVTPLSTQQMNAENDERETFKWFVNNDNRHNTRQQFLEPLGDLEALPTLETNS
jgi:CRISPR-associated protein (TIGR03986 family)